MPERWLTIVVCALVALVATMPVALARDGGQSGRRSYPQRFCPSVKVDATRYGVEGSDRISCRFMRRSTVRFLDAGMRPRHWACVDAGDTGGCHRRHHPRQRFDWYVID